MLFYTINPMLKIVAHMLFKSSLKHCEQDQYLSPSKDQDAHDSNK